MVKKRLLVRATPQGIERAEKALVRLGLGTKANFAKARHLSRTTVTKFFKPEPIQLDSFQRISEELTLPWREIIDLSENAELELSREEPNGSSSQSSTSDIDALVQEVRSRCCEAILDSYSKIRLPDDTRIDVDLLYVDVYVLEKLSSKRSASISGLLEGVEQREDYERLALGQRQKRLPGQEIVRQFPRLMVLGKPGSGKTTFLRHLAVDCSKGKFFCDRIPVLIELRSIKEGNSFNLLNLIHREFGLAQQEQTQQILNQGKAFILLDGLDEVPSQLRQSVRDQIYKFAKEYRKNRFVLNCRTQTIEYIADHFEPIEVANFDAEQVIIFALDRPFLFTGRKTVFLDLSLPYALNPGFDYALNSDLDFDYTLDLDLKSKRIDLNIVYKHICNLQPELQHKLQELIEQLPNAPRGSEQDFERWWQVNGQAWAEQFTGVMVEHRNIGHDWQFSEEQKAQLKQYYDANKLLVDCLNSGNVTPKVREEIEETLLLPIAEIKQRGGL